MAAILDDVTAERARQDFLQERGVFPATLAQEGLSAADRLAVVAEEFGEVSREVAEAIASGVLNETHLRAELVQLAACAVAWVEYIDGVGSRARATAPTLRPYALGVLEDGIEAGGAL
jgi:hypothetical protein